MYGGEMICPKCRKDYSVFEQWCPRCGERNELVREHDMKSTTEDSSVVDAGADHFVGVNKMIISNM